MSSAMEKIFLVKENECIGFEINKITQKAFNEISTQTTKFTVQEKATNTIRTSDVMSQTKSPEHTKKYEPAYDELARWLNKIYPLVVAEIGETTSAKIIKEYCCVEKRNKLACKLLQSIKIHASEDSQTKQEHKISAINWNCTGQILAVAWRSHHTNWCYHRGQVSFYKIDRNQNLQLLPHRNLTTSSCVITICFHPSLSSVIATGTYNGEICIWDIQHNHGDNIITKLMGHEGNITQASWIDSITSKSTLLLASSGMDGFINIWSFDRAAAELELRLRFEVKSPVLLYAQNIRPSQEYSNKETSHGITCFHFSPHIHDTFILGTEGGLVIQSSINSTNILESNASKMPTFNTILMRYEPRPSKIVNIMFSPFNKNTFMVNSASGEIIIYIIGQDKPLKVIFTQNSLTCCMWIHSEENLIVGCDKAGNIEIFDVSRGTAISSTSKEVHEKFPVTCIAMCIKLPSLISLGCNGDTVQLWSCSWDLFISE